jgi:hypothetical protein
MDINVFLAGEGIAIVWCEAVCLSRCGGGEAEAEAVRGKRGP